MVVLVLSCAKVNQNHLALRLIKRNVNDSINNVASRRVLLVNIYLFE